MSDEICTEKCWTPVRCPEHGDTMWPAGRSAPAGEWDCCDNTNYSRINTRHLFSEHDSTRHYHDPKGWAAHEATCAECNPNLDDEES